MIYAGCFRIDKCPVCEHLIEQPMISGGSEDRDGHFAPRSVIFMFCECDIKVRIADDLADNSAVQCINGSGNDCISFIIDPPSDLLKNNIPKRCLFFDSFDIPVIGRRMCRIEFRNKTV